MLLFLYSTTYFTIYFANEQPLILFFALISKHFIFLLNSNSTQHCYFLNLQGRISAEGLLMFGIGGLAIVYFIAPILDNMLVKIRLRYISIIFVILFVICLSDVIYSNFHPNIGHGITDYTSYNFITNTTLFWCVFVFSFYIISVIICLYLYLETIFIKFCIKGVTT